MRIKLLARATLTQVLRDNRFASYAVCRDERNNPVILVSPTHELARQTAPYIQVTKMEKRHVSNAIIIAHTRGRLYPTESDLYTTRPYRYRIVPNSEVQPNKPMEVYIITR